MAGRAHGLQAGAAERIGPRHATPDTGPGGSGILSALAAPAEAPPLPGERVVDIPLDRLAPHPDNIREGLGDLTTLTESIREHGVQIPLTVITADALRAATPGVALPARAGWVVIAGHRRRAAALQAGRSVVPCLVRDQLAGDDTALAAMLLENLNREGLTPLEEAKAFGRLRDHGWSERRIATAAGRSAGQVHKRLQLLRLPEPLAAALSTGDLLVADALRLLELPDDELLSAWEQAHRESWRGVRGVVEARLAARAAAAAPPAAPRPAPPPTPFAAPPQAPPPAVRPAAPESTEVPAPAAPAAQPSMVDRGALSDVLERLGRGPRPTPADTAPAAAAPPAAAPAPTRSPAEARAAACARLLTRSLDDALAAEILADAVLVGPVPSDEDTTRAAEWCQARHPGTRWPVEQADAGRGRARRAAAAVALAAMETALARAATSGRPWTAGECRHVRRLARVAGYELTDQDRERLDDAAPTGSTEGGR